MQDEVHVDLAVVGAGAAGLAAATLAAELGCSVEMLDEQVSPGGHMHQAASPSSRADPVATDEHDDREHRLLDAFERSGARHRAGATVWAIERVTDTAAQETDPKQSGALRIAFSVEGRASTIVARKLVLATGAQERPFAIPGGTLAGVTNTAAVWAALRDGAALPAGPIALAGCGPLLYQIADELLTRDADVIAIFDTLRRSNLLRALPFAAGFMRSPHFAAGGKLLGRVNDRVKVARGVTALEATGTDTLAAVRFGGAEASGQVPVSTLILHQGLVPAIALSAALGCAQEWDERGRWWQPRVDAWGATSLPDVHAAGDLTGVRGPLAAEAAGRIAALAIAADLGAITLEGRDAEARQHQLRFRAALRGRRFLDTLFMPPPAFRKVADDTIVCTCEGVPAREVRACVGAGCTGPNQLKAFSRCGMGECRGRLCGLLVTEIIAAERAVHPADVGHYRLRFPTSPVTLAELASLPRTRADEEAVLPFRGAMPADGTAR